MEIEMTDNCIIVIVEKEIYNSDVLHQCFYWYGNEFVVEINSKGDALFEVKLEPKNKQDIQATFSALSEKIKQDIVDFKLRDIVTKETKVVRELLIAKAFAHYDSGENPATEVSDPVGFNPHEIKSNGQ